MKKLLLYKRSLEKNPVTIHIYHRNKGSEDVMDHRTKDLKFIQVGVGKRPHGVAMSETMFKVQYSQDH